MDTNEILKNADDLVSNQTQMNADATTSFCTVWPTAKPGLEMLRDLVKGAFVKVAISAVIAAGDAASSKLCK